MEISPKRTGAPVRLNHVAYQALHLEETHRFYKDVLGMSLLGALESEGGGHSTTGEAMPKYLHFFYGMETGEAIAFFALTTSSEQKSDGLPTWTRHLALSVDSEEDLDNWRSRLLAHSVPVSEMVNHDDIWHSIYFSDPNGIRLELTHQLRSLNAQEATEGEDAIQKWIGKVGVNTAGASA